MKVGVLGTFKGGLGMLPGSGLKLYVHSHGGLGSNSVKGSSPVVVRTHKGTQRHPETHSSTNETGGRW